MEGKYKHLHDEVKKLDKMREGTGTRAQAYANETVANAQANPAQVQKDQVKAGACTR